MSTAVITAADLPASGALTASSWSAKLAGLVGRGASDSDPRVRACRSALAFHRVRTVIDRERDLLDPSDAVVLREALS